MSKRKESKRPESSSPKPAGQPSQLLFINRDPQNLTRTAEETHAIGSHVSKGSRKWKRTKSYLGLDVSTSRILSGTDSSRDDTTPAKPASSLTRKALKLRWRMLDGRVTSTRNVGPKDFTKSARTSASPSTSAARDPVSSASSTPSTPAPTIPTPFQSPDEEHNRRIHDLLQIYFQHIRPAVFSISSGWLWIDDFSFVLSSPVLTYAICAFTSAFTVGSQHGLDKLCLPPEALPSTQHQGSTPSDLLWLMPEWFPFQAQAISLLRLHLSHPSSSPSDPALPIETPELHAILFLMRLHVLLGNQNAASMHMSAITNLTENPANLPDLQIDMAMWRVNLILALAYPSAIRTRPYIPAAIHTQQDPLLDLNLDEIPDPAARLRITRLLLDRGILWTCASPTPLTVPNASLSLINDHITVDSQGYTSLPDSVITEIHSSLLIARYLLSYLRYVDGDTTLGCIRDLVPLLQSRLSHLLLLFDTPDTPDTPDTLWHTLPHVLTYLLFAGAFASRGVERERDWFTTCLARGVQSGVFTTFEEFTGILGLFLGLETVREGLLVEIWVDVMGDEGGDTEGGGDGEGGSRGGSGSGR